MDQLFVTSPGLSAGFTFWLPRERLFSTSGYNINLRGTNTGRRKQKLGVHWSRHHRSPSPLVAFSRGAFHPLAQLKQMLRVPSGPAACLHSPCLVLYWSALVNKLSSWAADESTKARGGPVGGRACLPDRHQIRPVCSHWLVAVTWMGKKGHTSTCTFCHMIYIPI